MPVAADRTTSDRLLDAAVELFARHGFHGTSIRDIAERAGVNVAAGHYHYGSKAGLYLAVLRAQFAEVRSELARRGIEPPASAVRRASRRELVRLFEARVTAMLEFLLGPPPSAHGQLMLREMCDPTEALPIIVAEFIEPQTREMERLVARLIPDAAREVVSDIAFSVIGQVLFYRFTMPVALRLRRESRYPRGFARKTARHITTFSLNAIDGMAAGARSRARAR
ncbi:MAG: CerR family C-terminal domain-containing protein [Deltaproteobacteria bacterium]|nr:CerR family C-terminal domain-containing protein [Deltaproteobacteria bacterium]